MPGRFRPLTIVALAWMVWLGSTLHAQGTDAAGDGAAVYRAACAACHGADGRGLTRDALGEAWPVPDFTSCRFAAGERLDDWRAIIRHGGPVRAFRRTMPAFGDALSGPDIRAVASHLRSFCRSAFWPVGDLNFPRALVTEKAFPENDIVVAASMPVQDTDSGELHVIYERRLGPRGQVEAVLPFATRLLGTQWHRGVGDVAFGYKQLLTARARSGTLVSAAASLTLPTGSVRYGLGTRLAVLEMSALASQRLPRRAFLHSQVGFAYPLNIASTPNEVSWRAAVGQTLNAGTSGRAWTPLVEVTAHRELEFRDPIRWDLVPQVQTTLSRRQHITISAGARLPVRGPERPRTALLSLTWDWFDGGLFNGW
jgi:cytochrome c553